MQIVIPMSGFGERFRRAGYDVPKPLIEIDGKPIIGHVIEMFPGEHEFIFICNQDHLDNSDYQMEATLKHYCPTGRVVGIAPHKLGPVYAVEQVAELLDPQRPVIVNYCDFTCYWDWQDFKRFVTETKCAGAIPAYKGFHPHTLGSTNYAYIRETGGWVTAIQEKQPYTDNRMEEYASSGTYYFASAALMLEAFRKQVEQGLSINDEFYVSLAYRPLLAEHLPVAVYPLQHFMQWGTPDDVAEYRGWSNAFRNLIEPSPSAAATVSGATVVPMAGLGQRFTNEGYAVTKPLIPVSGKPMVLQAAHDLPASSRHAFVIRRDMPGCEAIAAELAARFPGVVIQMLDAVTDGQARTALIGLDALEAASGPVGGPVTFGACDNGMLYKADALQGLLADVNVDMIVWGVRGHANAVRHPEMFGWIDEKDGIVQRVSVKTQLGKPATDPIILGIFTFRSADTFRRVVQRLFDRDGRIKNEFYLDSCVNDAIELGLQCAYFEVDSFLSWGTPNDLRTFEYWQSCFHKWASHPYRLDLDARVPKSALGDLELRYRQLVPPRAASAA